MQHAFANLTLEMKRELSLAELIGFADELAQAGQVSHIIQLYQDWLDHNGANPYVHLVHYNFGVVLLNANEIQAAKANFDAAIRLQPDFFPSYINQGNVLERLGQPRDAAQCWQQLVDRLGLVNAENIGFTTSALKQIARVSDLPEGEEAMRKSLQINPHQHDVMEHWINNRQLQCKWPVMESFPGCDKTHLMKGFAPLSLAVYTDDPMFQLSNACQFHKSEIGQSQPTFQEAHQLLLDRPSARIRVGYLSSDMRVHAIGFLMVEIFELHNREKVEVFIYSIGLQFSDQINQRIKAAADHWRDLSVLSDEEAARQIIADRIEILIDVNGYTNSSRTKMLSMRPAPVIVNWLGYPGTMGSPYHNYILADDFIIPEAFEIFYSEKVLRLPCYQPNDRKRYVIDHRPTRAEVGLPAEGMVYGCFNGFKKITAFTWRLWMRVLQQVEGSVLWLLLESEVARGHLVEMAGQLGIGAERIIFAHRQSNHEHMARYPLVDLMLDSSPYGAHTTASDALWMGVPILTMAGLAFPARVCGSLVRSAGLADLVCDTPQEYVARAVEIGQNRAMLLKYREIVRSRRDTCVLFDTPLLVSSLEKLLAQMQADFRQGKVPRPDLSNWEIYQEVGIELDNEGAWFGTVENLANKYIEILTRKDRLNFIPSDSRLWSSEARSRYEVSRQAFFQQVLQLDGQNDLEAFLQFVQNNQQDPQDMLSAVRQLLVAGRLRAAYIIAMLLANAGYQEPGVAVALCIGGVLFDNEIEAARGQEFFQTRIVTLSAVDKSIFANQVIRPVVNYLQAIPVGVLHQGRVGALLERLQSVLMIE